MSGAVQAMMGGALQPTGGGGQTWDPTKLGTNIALSVGNTVATSTTGGAWRSVLAVTPYSGVQTFNIKGVFSANCNLGIANSSLNLASYIGSDANGMGINSLGDLYTNGVRIVSGLLPFSTGDTINIKVDSGASTVAFAKNGGAFGSPQSFSITGPIYIAAGVFDNTSTQTLV